MQKAGSFWGYVEKCARLRNGCDCGMLIISTRKPTHCWFVCYSTSFKNSYSVTDFFSPQTERDVSVRQRAADLLYAMCDRSNAKQIVAEMLSYLETADYSIREEMVGEIRVFDLYFFFPLCMLYTYRKNTYTCCSRCSRKWSTPQLRPLFETVKKN